MCICTSDRCAPLCIRVGCAASRLADRFGRKAGFLAGMALFTLASLGCAVSPTLWALIGFRCAQAAGAAIVTPYAPCPGKACIKQLWRFNEIATHPRTGSWVLRCVATMWDGCFCGCR